MGFFTVLRLSNDVILPEAFFLNGMVMLLSLKKPTIYYQVYNVNQQKSIRIVINSAVSIISIFLAFYMLLFFDILRNEA